MICTYVPAQNTIKIKNVNNVVQTKYHENTIAQHGIQSCLHTGRAVCISIDIHTYISKKN